VNRRADGRLCPVSEEYPADMNPIPESMPRCLKPCQGAAEFGKSVPSCVAGDSENHCERRLVVGTLVDSDDVAPVDYFPSSQDKSAPVNR